MKPLLRLLAWGFLLPVAALCLWAPPQLAS